MIISVLMMCASCWLSPWGVGRNGWVRSSAWILLRVIGKLELVDPVRLETMRAPDALDETRADIDGFRHHVAVRPLGGRIGPGERHNTLVRISPIAAEHGHRGTSPWVVSQFEFLC